MFALILLSLCFVSALDSQIIIPCGGDNELVIGCVGDEQDFFIGKYSAPFNPVEGPVINETKINESAGNFTAEVESKEEGKVYWWIVIIFLIVFLVILFIYSRKRKIPILVILGIMRRKRES